MLLLSLLLQLLSLLSRLLLSMPLLVLELLTMLGLLLLLVGDSLGVDLRGEGSNLGWSERVSVGLVKLVRPRVSFSTIVPFSVDSSLPLRLRSFLPDGLLIQRRSRSSR